MIDGNINNTTNCSIRIYKNKLFQIVVTTLITAKLITTESMKQNFNL